MTTLGPNPIRIYVRSAIEAQLLFREQLLARNPVWFVGRESTRVH